VSFSKEEQEQIENEIKVEVKSYHTNFYNNVALIENCEQNLIIKILDLMSVSHQIIKKEESNGLVGGNPIL
jgi:hypothetical protein